MNKLRNACVDYTSIRLDKKQILNKIINYTENTLTRSEHC